MQVPFNYLMRDISSRSAVGMDGGRSVTRLRTQGAMQAAACDQSNAFTSIRVPKWMVRYQGPPPIPAKYVWALLPDELRNKLHHHSMVSACYRRLAMGSAHAVHILMMINLRIIGIAIRSHRFLDTNTTRPTNDANADELSVHTHDRASALSVARWRAECVSASSQVTRQVHLLVMNQTLLHLQVVCATVYLGAALPLAALLLALWDFTSGI